MRDRLSIKKKLESLKEKKRKNKNFGIQCFLAVFAAGYVIFFTSNVWMPNNGDLTKATPYYTKVNCEDNTFYVTQYAYSEKDRAIQIILEVENKDIKEKELEYSAVEKKLGNLKVKVLCEEPNYSVLRIVNLPKNWKEISFRVRQKGKETQAKFYTNIDEVEKAASLPKLTKVQCQIERLKRQISYDDFQTAEKEKQIKSLQKENREIEKRITALQEDTYPTDAEAQNAQELVSRAQSEKSANEGGIKDRTKEIEQLKTRSDNISKQIAALKEQEGEK